jgi:hypothetical protein
MAGPVGDRSAIGGSTRVVVLATLLAVLALGAVRPWLGPSGGPGPTAGIDLSARVAPRPTGGDPGLIDRIPVVSLTSALRDLAAHAAIDGPDLPLFGEPDAIEQGQPLAALRRASDAAGTTWLRVYVLPRGIRTSGYFAWIPATSAGEALVDTFTERPCPPAPDNLSFLAWLDPFTRARCLGAASLAIQGRTGLATWAFGSGDLYNASPAWMGGPADAARSAVAVVDPVNGALILRIPPGLEKPPPPDITIRASVHVADPVSGDCRRVDDSGSLPPEAAADSALWCSVQLVVEPGRSTRPPRSCIAHPGEAAACWSGWVRCGSESIRLSSTRSGSKRPPAVRRSSRCSRPASGSTSFRSRSSSMARESWSPGTARRSPRGIGSPAIRRAGPAGASSSTDRDSVRTRSGRRPRRP